MPYLMLDPVDPYAWEMMEFLASRDLPAVAVFSTPRQYQLWQHRFREQFGKLVVDEYLAPQFPSVAALAARIGSEWRNLAGVIPWDERSILLGAELGERLGLGWNPYRVIERCRDKAVMKEWLRTHGSVRINAARIVRSGEEALAFQREVGRWPIVVKPTEGAGSIDVFFPSGRAELLRDCQRVLEAGKGEVLLEEYIGGQEYAVNGVVDQGGDLLVTDVWRYDRRRVGDVDNLYYHVDRVASREPVFGALGHYAAEVVETLELCRAPIHMEVKVDEGGPCLIEVGARPGGGNLPVLASKLHGRSLLELAACHYIAHLPLRRSDVDFDRYDRTYCRLVSGIQGEALPRISAVHGRREVEALPSFDSFGMLRGVGKPAPKTLDLDTIAYEVYLIHQEPAQIELDSARVRQLLRFE